MIDKNNKPDIASANENKYFGRAKWLLGLILLFLISAAFLLIQLNKGGSYDKDFLIADNAVHFVESDNSKQSKNEVKSKAYDLYFNGEYKSAIPALKKLIKEDKNLKHKFFLAVSFIQIGQYKQAQKLLQEESIISNKKFPINYYLALSKIEIAEPKEAIELLSNPTLPSPHLDSNRKKLIRMLTR